MTVYSQVLWLYEGLDLLATSIKCKKQKSTGVAPLKNKEGFLHSDTTSKAEILNEQFQSVYTKENTSTMPDKGQSKYPSMNVYPRVSLSGQYSLS
jgi:hypothetical protein